MIVACECVRDEACAWRCLSGSRLAVKKVQRTRRVSTGWLFGAGTLYSAISWAWFALVSPALGMSMPVWSVNAVGAVIVAVCGTTVLALMRRQLSRRPSTEWEFLGASMAATVAELRTFHQSLKHDFHPSPPSIAEHSRLAGLIVDRLEHRFGDAMWRSLTDQEVIATRADALRFISLLRLNVYDPLNEGVSNTFAGAKLRDLVAVELAMLLEGLEKHWEYVRDHLSVGTRHSCPR